MTNELATMETSAQAAQAMPMGQELPPLGGRIGQAQAAESVKKRVRIRNRNKPLDPAQAAPAAPVEVAPVLCSDEQAHRVVATVLSIVKPALAGLAEKADPAAKKIDPKFTFALTDAEENLVGAVAVDCVKTLPAGVMPKWLPWVALAFVGGGMAWTRWSMVKQIKLAAKQTPAAPVQDTPK